MQARMHLPAYGRFASPDPGYDQHFEVPQTWNIYSYVRNKPTMMVDPNGNDARILFNYQTNAMTIRVPILLAGKMANSNQARHMEGLVNSSWNNSGQGWSYTQENTGFLGFSSTKWTISIEAKIYLYSETISDKDREVLNTVVLYPDKDSKMAADNTQVSKVIDNKSATIAGYDGNLGTADQTFIHEFGHFMGHGERYLGANVMTNFNNNIMGNSGNPMSKVEYRNIYSITDGIFKLQVGDKKDELKINLSNIPERGW